MKNKNGKKTKVDEEVKSKSKTKATKETKSKTTRNRKKLTKKKKKIILMTTGLILVLLVLVAFFRPSQKIEKVKFNNTSGIKTVLTLNDMIDNDSIWCGTFQLIWNDLKNDLAKQEIVFYPQTEESYNLNSETFTKNDISSQYYYKKLGHPTYKLKEEIEKEIKEKFNEKSDILDSFTWEDNNIKDYFLYAMLKKEFKFPKQFIELENSKFKGSNNIKYFGIDKENLEELKNQVEIVYYESDDDFAVKLFTKEKDEVILIKNPKEKTFNEIYTTTKTRENGYKDSRELKEGDTLKIPVITLKEKTEFKSLENKPFMFADGREFIIRKAVQTINFDLDSKGGKIKSEAGADVWKNEGSETPKEERKLYFDNTFTIFLIEKDKNVPYFAAKIDDIEKFQ